MVNLVLSEGYTGAEARPVLGQYFEERRRTRRIRAPSRRAHWPAFFANLLPEGALRHPLVGAYRGEVTPDYRDHADGYPAALPLARR